MPKGSPFGPIKRTSLAVIASLSRVSLSFALIVQHLQAKKLPYKDKVSVRELSAKATDTDHINPRHTCAEVRAESSALFYPNIVPHIASDVNSFFKKNLFFSPAVWYDRFVHRKSEQKKAQKNAKILLRMLSTKIFADFRHN